MKLISKIQSILGYYWRAQTRYDVHSPYVAELIVNVLVGGMDQVDIERCAPIETLRQTLKASKKVIDFEPLGAGSKVIKRTQVRVGSVASTSLSTRMQCEQLYRLVHWLKPNTIVELGTSLGVSTLYQQLANPSAQMISVEGRASLHAIACANMERISLEKQPTLLHGTFEDLLPLVFKQLGAIDYVFIDGDHRYEAVLSLMAQIMPKLSQRSVVVLHDIHWSSGMEAAWEAVINQYVPSVALDLYTMGILCFRPEIKTPIRHTLIKTRFKPWRLGFF